MDRFDYPLPADAIAQTPAEPRDAARLLVDDPSGPRHLGVADLPGLVRPGDVVVVNETAVLRARLLLRRSSGGVTEVLMLEERPDGRWEALVRPSRRVAEGSCLVAADGSPAVEVGERLDGGRRAVRPLRPVPELLAAHGEVPLPPYISEPLPDPGRYQTVFAARPGSVAAPTAGLHLTSEVLDRCRERGADVRTVDLAVGLDTFRPITAEDPAEHRIHSERYRVPASTLASCQAASRVVAVGTTTVRALESAARGEADGRTSLFIRRPFRFEVVDVLITNFHLPRSSLLLLVDAFVGDRWRALYEEALAEGYRFLSFGDAMWLRRTSPES